MSNPKCSESEIYDIANAVNDGVDCFVLSRETSLMNNPEKAVVQLSKIIVESEKTTDYVLLSNEARFFSQIKFGTAESVASAAVQTCTDLNINLIIVQTENGNVAKLVGKFKPSAKIFACTSQSLVERHLQLTKGIIPHQIGAEHEDIEKASEETIRAANKKRLCNKGDKVILIVGLNEDTSDEATFMKVLNVD